RPGEHWTRLPARRLPDAAESPLPPLLRWLSPVAAAVLGLLERLIVVDSPLRRFVLDRHERAFRTMLCALRLRPLRRIGVIGGGLFPRTVLVLRRLLPEAAIVVVDSSARNIALARRVLATTPHGGAGVSFVHARFAAEGLSDVDLLVTPLAFVG